MARAKMPSIDRILVVALMALAVAELVAAQAPAPAPSEDCTTTLINLSPCLDFISANDSKPPPKDCCTGLVKVVNENEICLCQLFVKNNSFGLTINETRAAAMPTLCKVSTPPLTTCTALGIPVSAPASSAASSPGGAVAGPAGNATAPISSSGTAGNFAPSVGLFAALVFAAFAV